MNIVVTKNDKKENKKIEANLFANNLDFVFNKLNFSLNRRQFLKLIGASFILLSGITTSCRRPEIKIMPYTKNQKDMIPGLANYYSTSMPVTDNSIGLTVKSCEGRPIKIEGNKMHPFSLGYSNIYTQSSILELYDPDRSRNVKRKDINNQFIKSSWNDWDFYFNELFNKYSNSNGKGLSFLIGNNLNSLSILKLFNIINKKFFNSNFYFYDPLYNSVFKKSLNIFFETNVSYLNIFSNANLIVTINSDPLMDYSTGIINSVGYSKKKKIYSSTDCLNANRLYSIEANLSVTGMNADHRLIISENDSESFLRLLIYKLLSDNKLKWPDEFSISLSKEKFLDSLNIMENVFKDNESVIKFINILNKDLVQNLSRTLIISNNCNNINVNILTFLLNYILLGYKNTFEIYENNFNDYFKGNFDSIKELCNNIKENKIETLIVIASNPSYNFPKELEFNRISKNIKEIININMYENETSLISNWHLPLSHFLESWLDLVSLDGTISLSQPLIQSLTNSRSILDFFLQFSNIKQQSLQFIKKNFYDLNLVNNENEWKKIIHDGIFLKTKSKVKDKIFFNFNKIYESLNKFSIYKTSFDSLELVLKFSYSLLDGRYSNLSWLQELPDPITKLTWDNAVLISPELANKYGINSDVQKGGYKAEIIKLISKNVSIETPAFIVPGINKYSIISFLGYGRTNSGYIGTNIGIDFYPFLNENGDFIVNGIKISKTNKFVYLACSQNQLAVNDRDLSNNVILHLGDRPIVRSKSISEYIDNFDVFKEYNLSDELLEKKSDGYKKMPLQMTDPWKYNNNKWGMVIDLSLCIGCNACSIACQAENNIPIVGKIQVRKGRIMSWIRIDRYFLGNVNNPKIINQPMLCMHCENAPCEPVCPVAATVHDSEGLNTMVYNRCIGTRYCANNCPYKIRRFNYLDFTNSGDLYVDRINKDREKILKMQKNPDVTIRYRGVMEKCSYCTQRIQEAKSRARREGLDYNNLPNDYLIPACAQACSTNAIIFGNMNAKNSNVLLLKMLDRNYDLLEELNIRPRTSYLVKLQNINLGFN